MEVNMARIAPLAYALVYVALVAVIMLANR